MEGEQERQFGEHDEEHGIYPIQEGNIVNEAELEHLLRYVLQECLQLATPLSDVPVLVIVPAAWREPVRLSLLRLFLERLGVGGVYFGDAPLMVAFGCATPTALVVNVGHATSEVAAIIDGDLDISLYERLPAGGALVDETISRKKGNPPHTESRKEARAIKEDVALFSASDSVDLEWEDIFEPLLVGPQNQGEAAFPCILTAIRSILQRVDGEVRLALFDHIILTGPLSRNPLLATRLKHHLTRELPTVSGNSGDSQLRARILDKNGQPSFELRTVPVYYPEVWQRATPLAAWFGGGITAKCVLGDSRNYYTGEDLRLHGKRIFRAKPV